jgi:hypothetical protein
MEIITDKLIVAIDNLNHKNDENDSSVTIIIMIIKINVAASSRPLLLSTQSRILKRRYLQCKQLPSN